MKIFFDYEVSSHQKINFSKTQIFFFNTPEKRMDQITKIFKCEKTTLTSIYQGIPLFNGAMRKELWNEVMKIIEKKLARWKGSLLTQARKLQLVKTTLQSMSICMASIFKIPSSSTSKID